MESDLTKLYNTLKLIETKGENTIIMAQCLNFTQALISKCRNDRTSAQPEGVEER